MKIQLLSLLMGASSFIHAQTTITKAFNDPLIGDNVNNVIVTGTVDNSAVGNPVTFSNPSITAGAPVVNTYAALTATDLATFPAATIKHNDGNGTTIYYKQNPTSLEIVGIANTLATINLSSNPATAITYPTAYGNTFTDTTTGTTSYSGTTLNLNGTVNTNANAYGTLIIGTNTYTNVLRLKIDMNFNIALVGLPINVGTAQNTMYMYFDATHKYPLLTHTSGNIVSAAAGINESFSGAQAQSLTFLSTNEITNSQSFSFYPNPTEDFINFKGNLKDFNQYIIITPEGKLIRKANLESSSIIVSDLGKGVYFIILESKTDKKYFRIIKK